MIGKGGRARRGRLKKRWRRCVAVNNASEISSAFRRNAHFNPCAKRSIWPRYLSRHTGRRFRKRVRQGGPYGKSAIATPLWPRWSSLARDAAPKILRLVAERFGRALLECHDMKRRAFTILSVMSLLLFAATCVLWARSYYFVDYECCLAGSGFFEVISDEGSLALVIIRCPIDNDRGPIANARIGFHSSRLFVDSSGGRDVMHLGLNIGGRSNGDPIDFSECKWYRLKTDRRCCGCRFISTSFPTLAIHGVEAPYFALLAILSLLPLGSIYRRIIRVRTGCCPTCGYDLCATPARCPECGTETTGTADERG